MDETKESLGKAFLSGLAVLLPLFIFFLILLWLYELVTGILAPVTNLITGITGIPDIVGHALVLVTVLGFILFIGIFARTTVGRWLRPHVDMYMQRVAPGYRMIREIVQHLFGDRDHSPFTHGSVALVQLYGPQVALTVTGIVTSRHRDGTCTVFVPTGPNPTSGFIYHVAPELVQLRPDIRVDSALRSVIACGMGSGELFDGPPPTQLSGPDTADTQPRNPPDAP